MDQQRPHDPENRNKGPIHAERHVRIICIGGGASGLLIAYKLQRHFQNFSLEVYEKNPELAGTWYENRYPGCACDVPSHQYTWSFEPKTDWSSVYASSSEIFNYFDHFAEKYALKKYCHTNHRVSSIEWNDARGEWVVSVDNLATGQSFQDHGDLVVNATGVLNAWKWPDIAGLDRFQGQLLHTADWDNSVDLTGKTVGLIGNGSSGIQVLPAIQPHVGHVTNFVRSKTWVSPLALDQHVFTPQEREIFANEPGALLAYRKKLEDALNGSFDIFIKGSPTSRKVTAALERRMRSRIGDDALAESLIPDWSFGCRRGTPGPGYLEALREENVTVARTGVRELTRTSIIGEDGSSHDVDVVICATGFDTTFCPRFPIRGHGQANLQDLWAKEPQTYLGVAAPRMPNYFTLLGPNSPVGNGPVLSGVEAQADWFCRVFDRFQTNNIHCITPTDAAVAEFVAWKDDFMRKAIWTEDCKSWYKASGQPDAKVTALWPGSTLHYIETLKEVRWDDFDVRYKGNRFAWLGDGHSQTERDPTADWSYYVREDDTDSEVFSRARRRQLLTRSGTVDHRDPSDWTGATDDTAIRSNL